MQILFYIIFAFYAIFAVYFATRRNKETVYFFLLAIVCQNIICIISYNFVSASAIRAFTLVKESMLYLSLFLGFLATFKIKADTKSNFFRFVSVYCLVVFWNFIFSPAPMQVRMVVFRFLALPILCIIIGNSLKMTECTLRQILRFILNIGLFLAVTGVVEYIVGDSFWTSIGYSRYGVDIKGAKPWGLINGVTANFYTHDFGSILRRFVTFTADPLASAFLMSLAFGIVLFRKSLGVNVKAGRFDIYDLSCILLTIVCVLTLSKAVFINMAILLMLKIYYNKNIPKFISRFSFFSLIVVIVLNVRNMIMSGSNSVAVHFNGFINGIMSSGLLGKGLGTAGASASMLAGAEVDVAESFVGSMSVQIGAIGTIAFLGIMWQIGKKIDLNYRQTKNEFFLLSKGLLWGLMISVLFSESSVTIMGTGIYFILLGIASRKVQYD